MAREVVSIGSPTPNDPQGEAPWRDTRRRRSIEEFKFAKSLLGDQFRGVEGVLERRETTETSKRTLFGRKKTGESTRVARSLNRREEIALLGQDAVEQQRERARGIGGREERQITTLNSLLGVS